MGMDRGHWALGFFMVEDVLAQRNMCLKYLGNYRLYYKWMRLS